LKSTIFGTDLTVMSRGADKPIPSGNSDNGSGKSVTDSELLVKYARAYFSTDFTNPSRLDCPSADALARGIRSAELPGDELRAHLLGCSECFSSYQNLRELSESAALVSSHPSWLERLVAAWNPRRPAIAISLLVCVVVAAGLLLWRSGVRDAGSDSARNTSAPPASSSSSRTDGPADSSTANSPAPEISPTRPGEREPEQSAGRPSREVIARNVVRIDLREQGLLRGDDETGVESSQRLAAKRNRFFVTLPANSPKGVYRVKMLDAYGHELMSKQAVSRLGKTLTIELDMRALPANKYRLCISLPEEAPDCYPLTVVRR
jgi:hypothetical protein